MSSLRHKVIRLAFQNPNLRAALLPLVAASAPPYPSGIRVSEDEWNTTYAPQVAESVAALGRAGARLDRYNPGDAFYSYGKFRLGRDHFSLGLEGLAQPGKIKSLARRLDKVVAIADEITGKDVFYDDLSLRLKPVMGSSKGKNVAFSILVDVLKNRGVHVHS